MLAAHNARATFFVIGRNITREIRPQLVRMVAEGHEIGNHTWSHPDLTRLSPAKLAEEMAKTNRLVKAYTGTEPHTLRPPYGTTNARVAKEAKRQGLAQILWTIDTNDWQERKTDVVVKRVRRRSPGRSCCSTRPTRRPWPGCRRCSSTSIARVTPMSPFLSFSASSTCSRGRSTGSTPA